MNSDIMQTLITSEGRYLEPVEKNKIKAYAQGMAQRILLASAIEKQEHVVVETTINLLPTETNGDLGEALVDAFRLHLRHIALAHIQDDHTAFQRRYVKWMIGYLLGMFEKSMLEKAYTTLGNELERALDAADFRLVVPFHRAFLDCLAKN